MHIGEIFGTAVSYIPVIRAVADIVTCIIKLSSGAVTSIEAQIKQIESIYRWLEDNNVNTFSEFYDKQFNKEK